MSSFFNYLTQTNRDFTFSIVMPSKLVLSWLYKFFDFALKSPMTTVKEGFHSAAVSRFISRFSINA